MTSTLRITTLSIMLFTIGCGQGDRAAAEVNRKQARDTSITTPSQEVQGGNSQQDSQLSVLDGHVTLSMPEGFTVMGEELLAAKYPTGNRPTLVYTNEDGSVNFAFNHTAHKVTEEQLPELLPLFVQQFNSIYPQMQWVGKELTMVNGKRFIVMEFITPAVDTRIYNLMYVTGLEGTMLMCSFNCTESQRAAWESKAKGALSSVEVN